MFCKLAVLITIFASFWLAAEEHCNETTWDAQLREMGYLLFHLSSIEIN